MPLPAGEDQRLSLRPRPANCSPAMIIACGSDSSFSMHSVTMRRAMRFVDATRGITATDSIAFRFRTMRVSIIERSLVLLKLFQSSAQLCLLRLRSGNDVRSEEHTSELQSQSNLVC